jgi:hypothetical protein
MDIAVPSIPKTAQLEVNEGAAQRNYEGARLNSRGIDRGIPKHQIESDQAIGGVRGMALFSDPLRTVDL